MSLLFCVFQDEFVLWMQILCLGAVFMLSATALLRYVVPLLTSSGHIRAIYCLFRILCYTALMTIIVGFFMFISNLISVYLLGYFALSGQYWLYSYIFFFFFGILFLVWIYGMGKEIKKHNTKRRMISNIVSDCDIAEDPVLLDMYRKQGASLGLKHLPILKTNKGWSGAFIVGIRQPIIVVPYKLYGKDLSEIALCHELVHYKQHHLFMRGLVDILNIIYWFLPYREFLFEEVKILQETICDMDCCEVMKSSISSLEYYSRIIKIVTMKRKIAIDAILAQLVENHSELMMRVQNINYVKTGKRRYVLLGSVTVLMAVMLLSVATVKLLPVDLLAKHQIEYVEVSME